MKDKLLEISNKLKGLADIYKIPCITDEAVIGRDKYIKQRVLEIVKDLT